MAPIHAPTLENHPLNTYLPIYYTNSTFIISTIISQQLMEIVFTSFLFGYYKGLPSMNNIFACTVPLKCNVAHAREFLSSNERVSSRLTSLHQRPIEVETEVATQRCALVYNHEDKYYPPRRFLCPEDFFASKIYFLFLLDARHNTREENNGHNSLRKSDIFKL